MPRSRTLCRNFLLGKSNSFPPFSILEKLENTPLQECRAGGGTYICRKKLGTLAAMSLVDDENAEIVCIADIYDLPRLQLNDDRYYLVQPW